MYFNFDLIIKVSKIIGAAGIIAASVSGIVGLVVKTGARLKDIAGLKEENTLICYALSACLDGLEQLGANHTVSRAKDKLDKHLNCKAHK